MENQTETEQQTEKTTMEKLRALIDGKVLQGGFWKCRRAISGIKKAIRKRAATAKNAEKTALKTQRTQAKQAKQAEKLQELLEFVKTSMDSLQTPEEKQAFLAELEAQGFDIANIAKKENEAGVSQ